MGLPLPTAGGTALVTGASSGIGAELARQLAATGHHVTLVARRDDELRSLAAVIASDGGRASCLPTDLGAREERAALPARVAEEGRGVDILVNCAGIATTGPISRAGTDAELRVLEIDVAAVVDLTIAFLPGMVDRGHGAILNVASTGAFQPLPGQASYGAAKAFVLSYTQSLAAELKGSGIVATVLCPGPVHTGFGERAGFPADAAAASLPRAMWVPVDKVAATGLAALERGKVVAIPGFVNRVFAGLGNLVPDHLLAAAVARSHPGLVEDNG